MTSRFLDGVLFNILYANSENSGYTIQALQDTLQDYKTNYSLVKLESKVYIDTYLAPIIPTNLDLILVLDYLDASNSLV